MKRFTTFVLVFALAGCASIDQWRRSHSFQERLYVADLGVPHLTKAEWMEITAQLPEKWETMFRDGVRESLNRVDVSLGGTYEGEILRFEKKDGKWIENKAKAEKVKYLIP